MKMLWTLFFIFTFTYLPAGDSKIPYGAKNRVAASHFANAIKLSGNKEFKKAMIALKLSVKADPLFQLGYYWIGLTHGDMGMIDESVESFKKAIAVRDYTTSVTVESHLSISLTYGKVGEVEKSKIWMSKALVLDVNNTYKKRAKMYRNMSVSLVKQKDYISALLSCVLAYEVKQEPRLEKMAEDIMKMMNSAPDQDVAMLFFPGIKQAEVKKRSENKELTKKSSLELDEGYIYDIQFDTKVNKAYAFLANKDYYYIINLEGTPSFKKISLSSVARNVKYIAGDLWVLGNTGSTVEVLDADTAKVKQSFSLGDFNAKYIEVFPHLGLMYFIYKNQIHELNMKTDKIKNHEVDAMGLRADRDGNFLYSYIKPNTQRTSGHMIINGRPVFYDVSSGGMSQTSLMLHKITPEGLVLGQMRLKASSNGYRIVLSPDKKWLALPGGGGWRPTNNKGHGQGYGVAVYQSTNLKNIKGFYPSKTYTNGAAFNPVSQQLAVVGSEQINFYQLSNSKESQVVKGEYAGLCRWSMDGKYFIAVSKINSRKKGAKASIDIFANPLTADELKIGRTWMASVKKERFKKSSYGFKLATKIPAFKTFKISGSKSGTKSIFKKALSGKHNISGEISNWKLNEKYKAPVKIRRDFNAMMKSKLANGILIYKIKNMLKDNPDNVSLNYHIAEAYQGADQAEKAIPIYIKLIQEDQAQTNMTLNCLYSLTRIHTKDEPKKAIYCAGHAFLFNLNDKGLFAAMEPLMKSNGFSTQAKQLKVLVSKANSKGSSQSSGGQSNTVNVQLSASVKLPKLKVTSKGRVYRKLSDLFSARISSTVLVKTENGFGSGVCVGDKKTIITNAHVVSNATTVKVQVYIRKKGQPVKGVVKVGKVVYNDTATDLAIIQLSSSISTLRPVAISSKEVVAGQKVVVIGNPGLGNKILELSLSEGVVASANREIEGNSYIQTTAAVNPGNSGGPMFDERGNLIGIITLKATLENVGFAIPMSEVVKIFKSSKSKSKKK